MTTKPSGARFLAKVVPMLVMLVLFALTTTQAKAHSRCLRDRFNLPISI